MTGSPETAALVRAIAHEVANHLAGIRFAAHLVGRQAEPAERAGDIDQAAVCAGALLALIGPLLREGPARCRTVSAAALLEAVRADLGSLGIPDGAVEVETEPGLFAARLEVECVRPVLVQLAVDAVAHGGEGPTRLRATRVDDERLRLSVEDCAAPLDPAEALDDAAASGRALSLRIARCLVTRVGGRLDAAPRPDGTHIHLLFDREEGDVG